MVHPGALDPSIASRTRADGAGGAQALLKGEMLDYYDISGCYILKPWSYGIWQEIQSAFPVCFRTHSGLRG